MGVIMKPLIRGVALAAIACVAMASNADAKAWRDKEPMPWGATISVELHKEKPAKKHSSRAARRAKMKAQARARAKAAAIRKAKIAKYRKNDNFIKSTSKPVGKMKLCAAPAARFAALQRIGLPSLADIAAPLVRPFKQTEVWSADRIALIDEREDAIQYLVKTATPGGTMTRQGVRLSIERLHPEFSLRLAKAIREARANGLPSAGIYSAYRAPGWGVGGFGDKYRSNHAIGQAVDMAGIGRPGSKASLLWYRIAGRNKLFNPYGPHHRAEWNHYQPQMIRSIEAGLPVRTMVGRFGPISLTRMWELGESLIRHAVYLGPAPDARRSRRHIHRYARRHAPKYARHHKHRLQVAGR